MTLSHTSLTSRWGRRIGVGMIGRWSGYASVVLCTGQEDAFLGARLRIDTSPRPDDRFHAVVAGDRVGRLAARYL